MAKQQRKEKSGGWTPGRIRGLVAGHTKRRREREKLSREAVRRTEESVKSPVLKIRKAMALYDAGEVTMDHLLEAIRSWVRPHT